MAYSRAFFDLQLTFARRLAARFHLPLTEAVYHYTTADVTQVLLQRVDALADITKLRLCFPYQVRQPQCPIEDFYSFFDFAGFKDSQD
jgi:hypothetical protein